MLSLGSAPLAGGVVGLIAGLAVLRVHQKNQFIDWQITKRIWNASIPATLLIV